MSVSAFDMGNERACHVNGIGNQSTVTSTSWKGQGV